jgi:hypothetical protein
MTPKEKAQELIDSMYNTQHCDIEHFPSKHYCDCSEINFFQAKQCALVAVDEIIKECCKSSEKKDAKYQDERINYWQQVKHEM